MSVHGLDKPSLLCLFIHGRHLPLDVRERLLEIVPRPAVPPLPTVERGAGAPRRWSSLTTRWVEASGDLG
jgi:hypothetical protein